MRSKPKPRPSKPWMLSTDPVMTYFGIPSAYWLDLKPYDPVAAAETLTLPMLILQGERDYQVTMTDFQLWQTAWPGTITSRLFRTRRLITCCSAAKVLAPPAGAHFLGATIYIANWISKHLFLPLPRDATRPPTYHSRSLIMANDNTNLSSSHTGAQRCGMLRRPPGADAQGRRDHGRGHARTRIAEEAGAVAVMALERVPVDSSWTGGVAWIPIRA